ncbi:MAG TPA: aminotransferase class V-fold PLP-dependent enzyme, partial [Gemmatimonadaceae bacterium]|nr:aminotransferase class V-fold PLP-dependent enzyme [Gemmatimonadaceae bacterium]
QASLASSALVAEARERVRRFFNADDYEVCFTANATGAIKLVAESHPFAPGRSFVLSADNHNSINGIREYAWRAGATVRYLATNSELQLAPTIPQSGPGLFAFPAQSNFSGVKHSLELVAVAQDKGFDVLLDAAAFVPTSTLDLRAVRPEFVALSFYKMFGYPTGVGALLVRSDALARLRRPWFGGGTVDHVTIHPPTHALLDGPEAFEDGTANFLAIAAIPDGLRWLETIGVDAIGAHATALARNLAARLGALRHRNGRPVVRQYGPDDWTARGAVVAFNVLDAGGAFVSHEIVEQQAREVRVSVRGGCFCNPGAAEAVGAGFDAPVPGAVRASLGVASDQRDVDRLVELVAMVAAHRPPARRHPWTSFASSPVPALPPLDGPDRTARTLR